MNMLRQSALGIFLLVTITLGGCRANEINSLASGIGAISDNPVYVTELLLNDEDFVLVPTVSYGSADSFPRTRSTTFLSPVSLPESFMIKAIWLEIISGRAYEAQTTVSASDLAVESGIGDLVILFLPGGQMVIGSDPTPRSGKIITRDIAKACGTRRPDLDRDIKGEVDSIAGVKEALKFATNPIDAPPCKGGM